MATSAQGSKSPASLPPSDNKSGHDYIPAYHGHTRGHGSFSASTIRSPTVNEIGNGLTTLLRRGDATSAVDEHSYPANSEPEHLALHCINAPGSVQAIVIDEDVLFAGLQGGEIVVWCLQTFQELARVHAHVQSVLGLCLSEDRSLLLSCGVDSVVNVWSTKSLQRLYSLESYFEVGDIFCVAYSSVNKTLFCGAQNSSIQWYKLDEKVVRNDLTASNGDRKHRFFDSLGPGGVPSEISLDNGIADMVHSYGGKVALIPQSNYLQYAHKSYVYAMLLATGLFEHDEGQELLITAGGGGTIKLWSLDDIESGRPQLLKKFKNQGTSVYSLTYQAPFLYAGLAHGEARVYNLSSHQLIRKLNVGHGEILQIQIDDGRAICATSEGWVKPVDNRFTETEQWIAHSGKILASAVATSGTNRLLVTGGNDNNISFWNLTKSSGIRAKTVARSNDELVNALRQFVSFRTIAGNPRYISECHQAATFLKERCNSFGASTSFISPQEGVNPILLAKFEASAGSVSATTVLFYGHYDVVDADSNTTWHNDPFSLHPLNGFLYGRGVTDNKGPILAALFAVADLVQQGALSCNVTFLLEGDEEAGSRGFRSAVQTHKHMIGDVDYVMLSNSYWLDDQMPCLTFGMRGVIHAAITVESNKPDLHSGVDGTSLQHEPLKDLTVLLASLIGDTGTDIRIPHFYESVDKLHPNELKAYANITSSWRASHPNIEDEDAFLRSLMRKWREPNLTIHQIQVPEAKTAVTISRAAKASLSIRIVPSQSADTIAEQLQSYFRDQFSKIDSSNTLTVKITSKADPWLGKVSNKIYSTLKQAVIETWDLQASQLLASPPASLRVPKKQRQYGAESHANVSAMSLQEPLLIREGGSIPAISFLEKEFDAPAAMFPMGQASDNAHLDNERIRLDNLYKGREIFRKVFTKL